MSLRILVADDNPDTVLTLRMLLEQDGHEVRAFSKGSAVVPAVREFQPNVCILDIEMPGANGHAIAAELRGIYKTLRPFMIAISGKWYSAQDRLVALNAGFDHFLEKPADPREVAYILDGVSRRLAAA
jgi:DNA-binding response OmpR family regulator